MDEAPRLLSLAFTEHLLLRIESISATALLVEPRKDVERRDSQPDQSGILLD